MQGPPVLLSPDDGYLQAVFHNQSTADPMGAATKHMADDLVEQLTGREVEALEAGEPQKAINEQMLEELREQHAKDFREAESAGFNVANLERGVATIKPWDDYSGGGPVPGPKRMTPQERRTRQRVVAAEIRKHFGEFGIEGGTIRMGVVGGPCTWCSAWWLGWHRGATW